MKLRLLLLSSMLVGTSIAAQAQLITTLNQGTSTQFDSDISSTDLIEAGSATLANSTYSALDAFGNPPTGVNDGAGGDSTSAPSVYLVGSSFPETFTFTLNTNAGTGGSATGYSISEIQSIAGWTDSNDASQNFSVSYETLSSPSTWIALGSGSFDNEVTGGTDAGTQTLLTDSLGTIASNVTALQFTYVQPTNSNATILHEVDVFGTATAEVPEPSTDAMMVAGLGALLFIMARKRRKEFSHSL